MKQRAHRQNGPVALVAAAVVMPLIVLARLLPRTVVAALAQAAGRGAWAVLRRRRRLATDNVARSLGVGMAEASSIARASFASFATTALPEPARLAHRLLAPDAAAWIRDEAPEVATRLAALETLHRQENGCIFVTPHLGAWEILPFAAAAAGIPLAVTVRPLDNVYLEALLRRSRAGSGQVFLDRALSLEALQLHLARGRSVGLLPDQAVQRGLRATYFGRPALSSPVPALLALRSARPVVVVACCRLDPERYELEVAAPIRPPETVADERAETRRLTEAMHRAMEAVVRRHPEQYFWMHDRWKGGAG